MNYTSENFKHCQFNPFEEYPFKAYPRLKEIVVKDEHISIDEDEEETDNHFTVPEDKMVRYILALYDPKSPLIKGETNLIRRKEIAAAIAGFDVDKEEDMLAVIYDCKYEHLVLMIQNFLRFFVKSMEWAMLVSYESAFWEFQSRLMQPIERGDKDKDLMTAVGNKTKLSNDIQELYNKFEAAKDQFYGNDSVLIKQALKIRRFTPEGVAAFAKQFATQE
jgi:hypothetical protein